MVKKKKKNKNEKYVGLGTSLENSLFSTTMRSCDTKLLVVAFLCDDDNKVSHSLVRSLVRSGSRFLKTFIKSGSHSI